MNKHNFHISKNLLLDLYINRKLSMEKIAKKINCSATTINKQLKQFKIRIRPTSEYLIGNNNCGNGKKHFRWNPEKHKIYYCKEINCNNEINYYTYKNGQGRCISCANKLKLPTQGMRGKKHTEKTKQKIRKGIVKHHIYLKENSKKTIKLSRRNHSSLHQVAYKYIYEKYGEKGIDSFLNWFNKNIKKLGA